MSIWNQNKEQFTCKKQRFIIKTRETALFFSSVDVSPSCLVCAHMRAHCTCSPRILFFCIFPFPNPYTCDRKDNHMLHYSRHKVRDGTRLATSAYSIGRDDWLIRSAWQDRILSFVFQSMGMVAINGSENSIPNKTLFYFLTAFCKMDWHSIFFISSEPFPTRWNQTQSLHCVQYACAISFPLSRICK
jgi:hypothetical protein